MVSYKKNVPKNMAPKVTQLRKKSCFKLSFLYIALVILPVVKVYLRLMRIKI